MINEISNAESEIKVIELSAPKGFCEWEKLRLALEEIVSELDMTDMTTKDDLDNGYAVINIDLKKKEIDDKNN